MTFNIHAGDVLTVLADIPSESVHCVVTSPPYWGLRDYGVDGQIGLESTPDEYVARMVAVFREVRRVLRDDGTLWLNLGDSYNTGTTTESQPSGDTDVGYWQKADKLGRPRVNWPGLKVKDLCGIPWRVAFALQSDGWYLRSDIIWAKPNPMPESVKDRPTKAHEYLFLMTKAARYWYDAAAVAEASDKFHAVGPRHRTRGNGHRNDEDKALGGSQCQVTESRNRRTVWTVATQPFPEAHFSTFPPKLIEPCVLAGCPVGGTVLDPFCGSGTTGVVALNNHRDFIGIELNPEYVAMAEARIERETAQQRMALA